MTNRWKPLFFSSENQNLMPAKKSPGKIRLWLRRLVWLAGWVLIMATAVFLFWLRGALYNRFVRFPREATAWQNLRAQRLPVTNNADWNEYRGILHSHSHFSHDSEVSFEQILQAVKIARLDFICLSDHCVEGRADFDWQWRGLHEGKLFIPGFEMKEGMMPVGVASGVVLSNRTDAATLAKQIVDHGGKLFYVHPEEPRDWSRPELTGMEIYNLHTDFKRRKGGLGGLLPDLLLNLRPYPDHLYHQMFQRPTEFLQHWDDLNRARHITGIAGNDCHQNVGFRAIYTDADRIRLEDTSPKTLKEYELNWFTRPLARWFLGPLEPNRKLFHVQMDPYERSARFVNTHVLARELSEPMILDSLRAGRVFVAFDMIADSSSFQWFVSDRSASAVMGEAQAFSAETLLHALSPVPCRFTVLRDGSAVRQQEGRALDWRPPGPGKYRVEAELKVRDAWVPWVYANPIELK